MTEAGSRRGRRSRNKGSRGEREAAKLLTDAGFAAERAQQRKGGQHSADIHCPELDALGLHLEVKRVEAGNPYLWLEQAAADAGGKTPLVLHRRNDRPWIAVLPLDYLLRLLAFTRDL